jgi:hypothetical protein
MRQYRHSYHKFFREQTSIIPLSDPFLHRFLRMLEIKYKQMEEENARLKRMYADLSLDHRILKDVIEKKL